MTQDLVLFLSNRTIMTVVEILLPILGSAMAIGLTIALLQATTSIQEVTLTFVPKIATVGVVMMLIMPWMLDKIIIFTQIVFNQIPLLAQ